MKRIKKIISVFLIMTMLTPAFGLIKSEAAEGNVNAVESDVGVTGNGSIGTLLAEEINKDSGESDETCGVVKIEFDGQTALVDFRTDTDADIVVAVFSEENEQMLASGTSSVTAEETSAQIIIEGTVPEYFIARAYMLDPVSHAPLCREYGTQEYTKAARELQDKTISDFDPSLVLNLDDDNTTNFGVYSESVLRVAESADSNVINDLGNGTYVISNADSNFTSLENGDRFSYERSDGNVLLVKVGSVTVDGNTVTVTEDKNVDMTDFFDCMKIELDGSDGETTIDDSTISDGLTRTEQSNISTVSSVNSRKDTSINESCDVKISYNFDQKGDLRVSGSFNADLGVELIYVFNDNYRYASVELSTKISGSIKFKAKIDIDSFDLSKIAKKFLNGYVNIEYTPKLVLSASASIKMDLFEYSVTKGFEYDDYFGIRNISNVSKKNFGQPDFEGEIFFGIEFKPEVKIGKHCYASLSAEFGLKVNGKLSKKDTSGDTKHYCEVCIAGDAGIEMSFKGEFRLFVKVLALDLGVSQKFDFGKLYVKIADFYFSVDNKRFGLGTCPYIMYKAEFRTVDEVGKPMSDVKIFVHDAGLEFTTDKDGKVSAYLSAGTHTVTAAVNGVSVSMQILLPQKNNVFTFKINDHIIGQGNCGDPLDTDAQWTHYEDGRLVISGKGRVAWWDRDEYKDMVTSLIIEDGITAINESSFAYCTELTDVQISNTVFEIGHHVFRGCVKLMEITIPDSVIELGRCAFMDCSELKSVKLSNSLRTLEQDLFNNCISLTGVTMSDNITLIEERCFKNCKSLTSIRLSNNLERIGYYAFRDCIALSSITIPDTVTLIDPEAFYDCTNLRSVYFRGDMPYLPASDNQFYLVRATVYYPSGNETYKDVVKDNKQYGGYLTWTPYTPSSVISAEMQMPLFDSAGAASGVISQGEKNTAMFDGLVAGSDYAVLIVKDPYADELLAPSNLLYIAQAKAGGSGKLIVQYVPRTSDPAVAMAYGGSNILIGDANRDGTVNSNDAIAMLRSLAGWSVQVDESVFDLDENGLVNSNDVIVLLRRLAGWEI